MARCIRPALQVAALGVFLSLTGCASLGSARLQHDQVDYALALTSAQKRQTLINIVGLRFGESPSVLPVTQVIAAYEFDGSASASFSATDADGALGSAALGIGAGYGNHPTFTFTPVTGEEYAGSYIRPLAPSLVLPLMQSGVPIDVLLRIAVQSAGPLRNTAALAGDDSAGDAGFFELIHALRRLQLNGALVLRVEAGDVQRVFLSIDPERAADVEVTRDAADVRRLLRLPEDLREVEIVYGAVARAAGQIAIVTRSVTGILTELGAQVEVPEREVASGATTPTVGTLGVESKPTIVIRCGAAAPADAYVSVQRQGTAYWIERTDFDSKFAFSVLQSLIALAQSDRASPAPVVTIPAG
ncbi:MAG TPA: hypothetical protein VJM11_01820 [Nevskiaceae bacterium]|nr:hypothetical protein [Nevskiaceae bacterium]